VNADADTDADADADAAPGACACVCDEEAEGEEVEEVEKVEAAGMFPSRAAAVGAAVMAMRWGVWRAWGKAKEAWRAEERASPSCPNSLEPHANTRPSDTTTRLCAAPAAIPRTHNPTRCCCGLARCMSPVLVLDRGGVVVVVAVVDRVW